MKRLARNRGFTLVDMLAVMVLVALLLMLGCSGGGAANDAVNRNSCINKARQLSLACSVFQNTTRTFPLATDAAAGKLGGPDRALAGTASGNAASGYSWIVSILPYVEEKMLYDQIRATTKDFSVLPFDPANVDSKDSKHLASRQLTFLRCPSSAIKDTAQAPAYANVAGGAAATNYVCIVGTNFLPNGGDVVANGILVPKTAQLQRGLKMKDIADGISKTVLLCESNEENYSSWLDGQSTWVTGMKETAVLGEIDAGGNLSPGTVGLIRGPDGYAKVTDTSFHALNFGPKGPQTVPYLKDNAPGSTPRNWGPSSSHSGGVVVHAFADNHASMIPDTIDATVYYRLITRRGGEPSEDL